jgi:hypothetical protein
MGACVPTAPAHTSASSICSDANPLISLSSLAFSDRDPLMTHPEIRAEANEEVHKRVVSDMRQRLQRDE